jgi:hypothetical protein
MTSQSATMTDHDLIRRWVEARDGTPAAVRATEAGDDPGVLRIRFSDESADDLDAIEWSEFLDQTAGGGASRFYEFVKRG